MDTTKKIFNIYYSLASRIAAPNPSNLGVQAVCTSFRYEYPMLGSLSIIISIEPRSRFNTLTVNDSEPLQCSLTWPTIGSLPCEGAIEFGKKIAFCAEEAARCRTATLIAGLTLGDFYKARADMCILWNEEYARLGKGVDTDSIVEACLARLGVE